ncbi:MAG: hypothetical protein K6E50_04665 [Lachnospiraceae bacterium]|nr:hypothetical protein [Lachnospiraceae bacterium]
MLKVLYADARMMLYQKGMRQVILAVSTYLVLYSILLKIIGHYMGFAVTADDIIMLYSSYAALAVTASTLFTSIGDFSDGCIRNKLILGSGRATVFVSAEIVGALQAVLISAAAFAESGILALVLTKGGLYTMTIAELADMWLIDTLALMSIGVFSTALVMVLGGKKSSYAIGLVISLAAHIFSLEVNEKLYPTAGKCVLSGAKLFLYRFYDRFVPYSYLKMRPHHETWVYLAGVCGLILLSTLAGILIFRKKEIA